MSRTNFFISKLYSVNLAPRASSSSGLVAGFEIHIVNRIDDPDPEEVGPDNVRGVASKPWIAWFGQPFGHRLASGLALGVGGTTSEISGNGILVRDRILNITASVENDLFGGILSLLSPHLGEERGETIVVIHGPAIKGMVVALGALDAGAHEDLSNVFGELLDVGFLLEEVGRGAVK